MAVSGRFSPNLKPILFMAFMDQFLKYPGFIGEAFELVVYRITALGVAGHKGRPMYHQELAVSEKAFLYIPEQLFQIFDLEIVADFTAGDQVIESVGEIFGDIYCLKFYIGSAVTIVRC